MKRVIVVGSGFGGAASVRALRKVLERDVEIVVVSPRPELLYYPGLIWIPTGARRPEDLVVNLTAFFRKNAASHHSGTLVGLEDGGRTVVTDNGSLSGDVVLIATGALPLRKLPGIEHSLSICSGLEEAIRIREGLAGMARGTIAVGLAGNPEEPSAVRGGPVFEILFGIDTWLRQKGRRGQVELVFFSPAAEPGNRLGPEAVRGLLSEMKRRGIATHLGHKLVKFSETGVTTAGGEIPADMIVFTPGLRGADWIANTDLERSPGGFIRAERTCQVPGHPPLFVVGDTGAFPGPDWMPKQGHSADLQADVAAANIKDYLEGRQGTRTFRVELVCVVDSLNSGTLVYRTPSRNFLLKSSLMHNAKAFFERRYLARYR